MAILETIVIAFWAMLPAYVPNNAAVLAGGGRPIDGGRTWGTSACWATGRPGAARQWESRRASRSRRC